jgi:hypothetical protein
MNVKLGIITSSPFLTPYAARATCNAEVPELTAIACFAPTLLANACSNSSTFLPLLSHPDLTTS